MLGLALRTCEAIGIEVVARLDAANCSRVIRGLG